MPRPAGFRIPAQWANRFSIRVQGGLVRVVFGDALVGAHASFHTHIAITADYAKALADSLQQMIAKASPPAKE